MGVALQRCLAMAVRTQLAWRADPTSREPRGIVYCRTPAQAVALHGQLQERAQGAGFRDCVYLCHGQQAVQEKESNLLAWMNQGGGLKVMVATSAFGVGIDYPSVRWVIHAGPAYGLLDYAQQSGRAGRDGRPAKALLLCTQEDIAWLEGLVRETENSCLTHELELRKESMIAMLEYVTKPTECLRYFIQQAVDGPDSAMGCQGGASLGYAACSGCLGLGDEEGGADKVAQAGMELSRDTAPTTHNVPWPPGSCRPLRQQEEQRQQRQGARETDSWSDEMDEEELPLLALATRAQLRPSRSATTSQTAPGQPPPPAPSPTERAMRALASRIKLELQALKGSCPLCLVLQVGKGQGIRHDKRKCSRVTGKCLTCFGPHLGRECPVPWEQKGLSTSSGQQQAGGRSYHNGCCRGCGLADRTHGHGVKHGQDFHGQGGHMGAKNCTSGGSGLIGEVCHALFHSDRDWLVQTFSHRSDFPFSRDGPAGDLKRFTEWMLQEWVRGWQICVAPVVWVRWVYRDQLPKDPDHYLRRAFGLKH